MGTLCAATLGQSPGVARMYIYIIIYMYIYIYIFIYLFNILILLFFSCFSVGPPGVGPEHPIATFQRYKTSLEVAQAQVDLRDLQIPGLNGEAIAHIFGAIQTTCSCKGSSRSDSCTKRGAWFCAGGSVRAPIVARGSVAGGYVRAPLLNFSIN